MLCTKCGTELKEGTKICKRCGSAVGQPVSDTAETEHAGTVRSQLADLQPSYLQNYHFAAERKPSGREDDPSAANQSLAGQKQTVTRKKKSGEGLKTGIGVAAAVLVIAGVSFFLLGGADRLRLNRNLSMAGRYLEEMDYEQAITYFEEAIKIDSESEDAYLGLAEAYAATEDYESAIEVLQNGIEETESEVLKEYLEGNIAEWEEKQESAEEGEVAEPGDYAIDWKDANLEAAMREITGITEGDIMFSDVREIRELFLYEKEIDDISALSSLTNLQTLNLNSNNISDVSALSNLTNLQRLLLSDNNISDISALSGLINLQVLYLSENDISDISALSGWINLRELGLTHNDVRDISALSGLINLQQLYLSNNDISDISALSGLANLQQLYLSNNDINDISALSGLINLQVLYLYKNDISDINVLRGLTSLQSLDLTGNNISDYSPVEFVPVLYRD